jgi:large subunit ribosomal protein L6
MSRVGKLPVAIPSGVECVVNGQLLSVSGKLGKLSFNFPKEVTFSIEDQKIKVIPVNDSKKAKAMWGLSRSLVNNMVTGVAKGFEKRLEITGVGYKAAVDGKFLTLNVGLSHEVKIMIPEGVTVKAEKPTSLLISGYDKQRVGEMSALIMKQRPPEPYKGKGISDGRPIRRKEGKKK